MARNRTRPMTDEEFELLREDLEDLKRDTAAALAEDLGGDPEDYLVGEELPPDGSE